MCVYLKRLFTKHNPSVLLISILLLFLPVDVALNFKGLGDTSIINYFIVLIDFVLLIEIISRKKISINRSIIAVSFFFVCSSIFMIPEIT